MVTLVWKPKHVAVVNKMDFNPDGGVGMKTETCSYCKQKDFLTLMVALVWKPKRVAVVNKRVFIPDGGVGLKTETRSCCKQKGF